MKAVYNYFKIRLPKEFVLPSINGWDNLDFKWEITINYSCNAMGEQMALDDIECSFHKLKYLTNWEQLEEYLLGAAKNNYNSMFAEIAPELKKQLLS
jgi:hypothetical protein